MILNERILQMVVKLGEELHFGRAASELHVSQPALSGTIKSLEHDLGVSLFRRTSRSVEMTDAGHVFVAEARRLIEQAERALTLVRGSSADARGPLRIGYPALFNLPWLCSLMGRAQHGALAEAQLDFVSRDTPDLQEDLIKRTLHAGFFAGPFCHPDLHCVTLFREPLKMVCSAGHPLAKSSVLTFDRLQNEPVVWLDRAVNPAYYDGVLSLCISQAYRPKIVQQVGSFFECLEFARAGLGVTFLPSHMESNARHHSVVFRPLHENFLHTDYKLAYRRDGGSSAVARFVKFARAPFGRVTIDQPA